MPTKIVLLNDARKIPNASPQLGSVEFLAEVGLEHTGCGECFALYACVALLSASAGEYHTVECFASSPLVPNMT